MGVERSEPGEKGSGPRAANSSAGRSWLELSDADLFAQSAVDVYRASGPGGQKRNKTSSAVRIRHGPTGLIVTATESRSQHQNRLRALRRLRETMALDLRSPVEPGAALPAFFTSALQRDPTLQVNRRHPDYWRIVQYVLDVFASGEARVARAAGALGISTGHLVRFLRRQPKLWERANRVREAFGRPPLR